MTRATAWLDPQRLTGMAVPMLAWATHFMVVYSVQGVACARDALTRPVAGAMPVTWWFGLSTLAALAVIAWQGWRAWRGWRGAAATQDPDRRADVGDVDDAGMRRGRFACAVTGILAALAAVATVFTAIPILLLTTCN